MPGNGFGDPAYWRRRRALDTGRPVLKPRDHPCADCPTNDMYEEICHGLAMQPKHERLWHSERWFCHETRDRACRGNWNIQALDKEPE